MAGGKLTPRQKMINMMYLVLTALLALNVSKEILNAFKTVNGSLDRSNTMIDTKNQKVIKSIEREKETDPEKVAKLLQIVKVVETSSGETTKYLTGLQETLDKMSEKDDDLEPATQLLVEGPNNKGKELKNKLESYKETIQNAMKEYPLDSKIPIDITPPKTENTELKEWHSAYFHMVPKIAALTILNKFKNDVKNTEAMCIERLAKEAVSVDIKLDQFKPLVSAKSSYLLLGDKYEASIGVGAFSSQIDPEITVNGNPLKVEPGTGMAKYEFTPGSAGDGVLNVKVGLKGRKGMEYYEDKLKYTVGVPSGAAVMLDKMNVLYIGVDNPITVSSGAGDEKTSFTVNGGGAQVRKAGPGKYIAVVSTPTKDAQGIVSVTGGKSFSYPLRVKRIPDPVPTLGGKLRGGNAQPGSIKAQSGIVPLLENFDFEARFDVLSYSMVYVSKGEVFRAEATGPLFSSQMQTFLTRAKPKDVLYLEEIKVIGPDKQSRKIGQIVFTII